MMSMEKISSLLPEKIKPEKVLNDRQMIIKEMVCAINVERLGTKFKPITGRAVAMKVSHLKNIGDLFYLHSICKDYKNRHGHYSKCFFGSLKVVDKDKPSEI